MIQRHRSRGIDTYVTFSHKPRKVRVWQQINKSSDKCLRWNMSRIPLLVTETAYGKGQHPHNFIGYIFCAIGGPSGEIMRNACAAVFLSVSKKKKNRGRMIDIEKQKVFCIDPKKKKSGYKGAAQCSDSETAIHLSLFSCESDRQDRNICVINLFLYYNTE